jgi:hypothetical protein
MRSCFSDGTASSVRMLCRPVGELDEDDANVARHREQHLAEVLGLRLLERRELDAVDLRDAVDEVRDGLAEALGDLALGGRRVLDDVVQEGRDQGLRVEVPFGEDPGDRERVGDVRLAALAVLARMGGARDLVRLLDGVDVFLAQVPEGGGELLGVGAGQRSARGLQPLATPCWMPSAATESKPGTDHVFHRIHGAKNVVCPRFCLPGLEDRRGRSRRVQQLAPDLAAGDFAQRDHGGLVLVGLDHGRRAEGDLACAVGRREGELEAVRQELDAVVDSDAGHGAFSVT